MKLFKKYKAGLAVFENKNILKTHSDMKKVLLHQKCSQKRTTFFIELVDSI